ncbi:MAG TPA: hypothetical protein DCY07_05640, partial [Rhodospirillaceae bacterium]|nr:hypothetical protein [Rhodospirillaceae bacterium]
MTILSALALSAPALAQDDKTWLQPAIGEGYGVQVKEARTTDEELTMIKDAGLTYVRFVIPWYEVEKGRGSFVWGYFDTFVKRLREQELKAVIVLGGGHPAYTKEIKAPEGNIDGAETYLLAPSTPESVAAFARYAAKTVSHFGGDDIIWELWNEPDSDRFWAPRANVKDYTVMADAACRAMRKAAPTARIVGPGMAEMAGRWGTMKAGFLGAVLRSPALACFDAISMHPYRDGETPPETVLPAYKKLRAFIKAFTPKDQKPLPVLSTEWGFTTTEVSEDDQAAFLLRSFLLNSLSGVPVSIWYEWRDARAGQDDPEAHFGLLTLREKEKESYRALLDFLPPLKGARIEARLDTGRPEEFVLRLKRPDGRYALVLWTSGVQDETQIGVGHCEEGQESKDWGLTPMPRRVDCEMTPPSITVKREKR